MIYSFDGFELDTARYELRRNGERRPLERQVYDVLAFLVENHERVVTKRELFERVWGDEFVSESALSSRIMAARRAVGDDGKAQRLIQTVHGRGFRFVGDVGLADASAPVPAPVPDTADRQDIRFCRAPDGVRIAYACSGTGPPLVRASNWLTHLEHDWQSPVWGHWLRELSRYHTLIRYDERGCGLSDREVEGFGIGTWVADLEAVVDAAGYERFDLLGVSRGASVAIAYAVKHPERVKRLVLYGGYARGWGKRPSGVETVGEREALLTLTRAGWGRDDPSYRQIFTTRFIPDATLEQMRWFNDLQRNSTSAENAARLMEAARNIDIVDQLARVRVPTLVMHARDDQSCPFPEGRELAAGIPNARFVPLEGRNHILLEHEPGWAAFLREMRAFLEVGG